MEQVAGLALHQTLSPQMQQSLHVLQAPIAELRQLVDQELRSNPALEEVPREEAPSEAPEQPRSQLESEWGEYFAQRQVAEPWTREALERRQHFFDSQARATTLSEHLLQQLLTASWPREDAKVAAEIIGNLDDHGFLRAEVEEIAWATGTTPLGVERVLEHVQEFEPPGIAARNLREALLIQLRRSGRGESTAARIVDRHLEDLGRRKMADIARALGVGVADVQAAADEIAGLDPRPGGAFSAEPEPAIVPDVVVERDGGAFVARLNNDEIPQLRIADAYKDMVSSPSRDVRDYLREKIKEGRFFIKSVQQRQQTILNIASEIVARQQDFFESGPSALKPMTMSQVAAAVGVHETTVSRAAAGKFMATPRGIFEIKYFFTHGYTTSDGETVSNETVRQAIAALVKEEDPRHPLSDQEIVKRLGESGLAVARRTVAKYRDQLGILPSHLRRTF